MYGPALITLPYPSRAKGADMMPSEWDIEVQGFNEDGQPVHGGLLTHNTTWNPVYVTGSRVRVVPRRKKPFSVDASADSKEEHEGSDRRQAPSTTENDVDFNSLNLSVNKSAGQVMGSLFDMDAMPDAEAKLERLPSNTPVLRPCREATGVERRWRSPADDSFNMDRMPHTNASYVSNAATVEVGDSDAESKDGSTNSVASSLGERPAWARYSALNNVISTGLPVLTAMSSASSEGQARGSVQGLRSLLNRGASSGQSSRIGNTNGDIGGSFRHEQDRVVEGASDQGPGLGKGASNELHECIFPDSLESLMFAGEGDALDKIRRSGKDASGPSPPKKWVLTIRAAALPRKARLQLYLEGRRTLSTPGPSLEEVRDWMRTWTREMDLGLVELLGIAGTKSVGHI